MAVGQNSPKPGYAQVNVRRSLYKCGAILAGASLGAVLGAVLLVVKSNYSVREKMYVAYGGELLFQMFHCVSMPLVMASVTCSTAYIHHPNISARLCLQFLAVFLLSKLHVLLIAVPMTLMFRPGEGLQISTEPHNTISINQNEAETFLDLLRNIFPLSIIRMTMSHEVTNVTMVTHDKPSVIAVTRNGCNWLGLVMMSVFIGSALRTTDPAMESPVFRFFKILIRITTIILQGILYIVPVLVISTVAGQLVLANSVQLGKEIGKYCAVVILAMVCQVCLFYPSLIGLLARKDPLREYRKFSMPFLVAFATGSSLAAMPSSSTCFGSEFDPDILETILPLAVILNKDGAYIFLTTAAMACILYTGGHLGVGNCITSCLLSIPLSMACPGIPQGGFLVLVLALIGLGVPYHDLAIVLVMDWIVDRFLTLANVAGAVTMVTILNHWNICHIDEILHEEQIQLEKLRQEATEAEKQAQLESAAGEEESAVT